MALSIRSKSLPGERAFHQAVENGGNGWYAACLRITGNPAQAQDAVQDGLLNAWRSRSQFRGGAKLETWIHRIVVNSALGQLRRRHPDMSTDDLPDRHDDNPGPADTVATGQLADTLEEALQRLSAMERTCFVLKHLEQWRLAEIATELGLGTGPVKQALFRAVRKLRTDMTAMRSE